MGCPLVIVARCFGRYRWLSGHCADSCSVARDRAAKLAAIPAGGSPANRGVQSLL